MCAELSGNAIDNVGMGCQTYVNDAQKYIALSNKGVSATEMRREIEKRDREIDRLKSNTATLQGQVDKLLNERGAAPSLETVQQLISQVMGRPVHTPGLRLDPQADMINANHRTTDITNKSRSKVKIRPRGKSR
jgi:hypothetical protein